LLEILNFATSGGEFNPERLKTQRNTNTPYRYNKIKKKMNSKQFYSVRIISMLGKGREV
jgi:hypothetical protein